ncbi:Hypothetical protein HDN1F_04820 [gamma proteobacterium HdN1]|nr:Hypothetical protein HDN1F_04820 [gamma proteobacterium HdN1]
MTATYEMDEVLDVRVLVPIQRHEKLLKLFKDLPVGESFTFINDHDPIPLYYEFRSIHGDVVGWEYLNRGGRDWKVKVTRTEASKGREFRGASTLMDLRKIEEAEWKHVVLHRYAMMQEGDVMELVSAELPAEIYQQFTAKFAGRHDWQWKKQGPDEFIAHITKKKASGLEGEGFALVAEYDLRPYPPAERHEMFYKAFADIKAGEAFEFLNDHDPKPLYYQMEAESKDPFRWEYLEQGPEDWRVRVVKTGG